MRNDLQKKIRRRERSSDLRQIGFPVFVTHCTGRDPKRPVFERSDQRIDFGSQRWLRQFLWKAPELTATGDRPLVVEKHAVGVAASAAAERDRDHLSALGVIAEAIRVRHADEFVFYQWLALIKLEWLGHHCAQLR